MPASSTASSDEQSHAIAAPVTSGGAPRNRCGELVVARLVVGGEAGVDVERDDALSGELHVQLAGDAEERGLRRAVAETPATFARGRGRVHGRGGRRHVHDAPATAFEHPRHDQLDEVQLVHVVADDELGGGVEVELEDAVHAPGALVDRVVDQRVDATPCRRSRCRPWRRSRDGRGGPSPPGGRVCPRASMAAAVLSRLPSITRVSWSSRTEPGAMRPSPSCTVRAAMATS